MYRSSTWNLVPGTIGPYLIFQPSGLSLYTYRSIQNMNSRYPQPTTHWHHRVFIRKWSFKLNDCLLLILLIVDFYGCISSNQFHRLVTYLGNEGLSQECGPLNHDVNSVQSNQASAKESDCDINAMLGPEYYFFGLLLLCHTVGLFCGNGLGQ